MSGWYTDLRCGGLSGGRKIIKGVCKRRGTLVIIWESEPDASSKEKTKWSRSAMCEKEAIIMIYEIQDKIESLLLYRPHM